MNAETILRRLEEAGIEVTPEGENLRLKLPPESRLQIQPLISELRENKAAVLERLRCPQSEHGTGSPSEESDNREILHEVVAEASAVLPPLPPGLRLVSYAPKKPPVALESVSVVTDVEKFIQTTLADLDARLNNPVAIHGGWSVWQMLDRLRQVGVDLEIKP